VIEEHIPVLLLKYLRAAYWRPVLLSLKYFLPFTGYARHDFLLQMLSYVPINGFLFEGSMIQNKWIKTQAMSKMSV
jgi:hypothetical protein